MLFMLGFGKIKKPQLEFYKINIEEDIKRSLVSFVHKKGLNKRIRAQKGAFINFDKLVNFINFQKNEIKLEGYKQIDRIILKIKFDRSGTLKYLENQISNEDSESGLEQTETLSNKDLQDLIKLLEINENDEDDEDDKKDDSEQIIDSYYDLIQKELLRKLKEFNYETNNLFPDFVDYLNYKSKEFKLPKKKKSKKVGLGNLKKIDESNKS